MALRSALQQAGQPEVLVLDDGSTDGTAAMVRGEFPSAVLHRFDESKGYIVRRNEGARLAHGEVIFSMDDDAAFSTADVVEQTLRDFSDPRIGAVAIPYTEPNKDNVLRQSAPSQDAVWVTNTFIGTAHALRRDLFLKLGGYRENLVHQGEESDFCIRMLEAGCFVRLGNSPPIIHYESPKRDCQRMDYYGRRNDVLFHWQNTPIPELLWQLPATMAGGVVCAARVGRWSHMLRGMCAGFLEAVKGCERNPVSRKTSRFFKHLKRSNGVKMPP